MPDWTSLAPPPKRLYLQPAVTTLRNLQSASIYLEKLDPMSRPYQSSIAIVGEACYPNSNLPGFLRRIARDRPYQASQAQVGKHGTCPSMPWGRIPATGYNTTHGSQSCDIATRSASIGYRRERKYWRQNVLLGRSATGTIYVTMFQQLYFVLGTSILMMRYSY